VIDEGEGYRGVVEGREETDGARDWFVVGRWVGRVVADVYDGHKWVNLDMVFAGMAWHYKAYYKDARLASVEGNVRKHGVGLWKQKDPVAPWDFRKAKGKKE